MKRDVLVPAGPLAGIRASTVLALDVVDIDDDSIGDIEGLLIRPDGRPSGIAWAATSRRPGPRVRRRHRKRRPRRADK